MERKSVIALVMCVLLTASIGQAAYSTVGATGTLGWSNPVYGPTSGSNTELTGNATGADHYVGAAVNVVAPEDVLASEFAKAVRRWNIGWQSNTVISATLDLDTLDLYAPNVGDYATGLVEMEMWLVRDAGGEVDRRYTSLEWDTREQASDETQKTVSFDNISTSGGNAGQLYLSVKVTGEAFTAKQPEPPAPVVPAPGAVLLGSLGAGLVGWLRRNKSL